MLHSNMHNKGEIKKSQNVYKNIKQSRYNEFSNSGPEIAGAEHLQWSKCFSSIMLYPFTWEIIHLYFLCCIFVAFTAQP